MGSEHHDIRGAYPCTTNPRHRSHSASEANTARANKSHSGAAIRLSNNHSGSNHGSNHQNNKLGRFGWVRRFIQSNKLNNANASNRHKRHSSDSPSKMRGNVSDTETDMYFEQEDNYEQQREARNVIEADSVLSSINLNSMYNFESYNDNVSTKPLVSRSNSSKLTARATDSTGAETINNQNDEDDYTISTLGENSQLNSRNNSLYVNNPRNGFALDMYSMNENPSNSSLNSGQKIIPTDFNNEAVYDNSTRQSTKSAAPVSIFDHANASVLGTPETSVASVSLFPASTQINNYTYSNPIPSTYNQNLSLNNYHYNYTRSIANSTINNNDSSSIITLASSTKNVLNRSKSSRRSVETFNSSTIGIPPSSIFERLNYNAGAGTAGTTGVSASINTAANGTINENLDVELLNNGNNEGGDDVEELEIDDLYSLNNSLKTHYSPAYNNRPANDNNSFRSLKTGRLSIKSINSVNE